MTNSHLTLRAALAENRLEDFVAQEETHGVEIGSGSDFERAVALLSVRGRWRSRSAVGRRPSILVADRRLRGAEIVA
jgi:hypothetical protein